MSDPVSKRDLALKLLESALTAGRIRPATADDPVATSRDLATIQDIPSMAVVFQNWTNADGRPVQWKLRGLNLIQQESIRRAQRLAVYRLKHEGKVPPTDVGDDVTFTTETLRYGVIDPPLSSAEAKLFEQRNPGQVELASSLIWLLTDLQQDEIDALLEQRITHATA